MQVSYMSLTCWKGQEVFDHGKISSPNGASHFFQRSYQSLVANIALLNIDETKAKTKCFIFVTLGQVELGKMCGSLMFFKGNAGTCGLMEI